MNQIKNIAVLGSTGSIGTQTLDIIAENPQLFRASVLTAARQWELLASQARRFRPSMVVIADPAFLPQLKEALKDLDIRVEAGAEAIAEAAALPEVDMVITAMVGYSGLLPTISAINAGKTIGLANKETLVVAGEVITRLLRDSASRIIPVDSEHSAIFQCLVGEEMNPIEKIILTASGGPFRTLPADKLASVTVKDALNHPNWSMGAKVTIDSASMMNKGFEMIEARWLFNTPPAKIEVAVHPQSIVHSMVEFADGSVKAQLGVPDMHLPIAYAMSYPCRIPTPRPRLSLQQYANLTFEAPDFNRFPMLGLAFEAIARGGNAPCVLNAANEVAVAAFLNGSIGFMQIPELVTRTMELTPFMKDVQLSDLVETNAEALNIANSVLSSIIK